jgi:ATP-dependent DNA helicase RecG
MTENNRIEYKRELTDSLEKEAVAFLNYKDGGLIYIGIDKEGQVYGLEDCDKIQLAIKDRLKNNIQPSIMGLFDIVHEKRDNRDVLRIIVAGGLEKPYYLKKYGMTEKGCYLRIGSASEPMSQDMIDSLYGRPIRNTIGRMESPRQELAFEQLKIYYETRGLALTEAFMKNLDLLTPDGKPNYAAYLLADDNGTSLLVAKYADTTRVSLIENRDFGRCSLVKALKAILERMDVENTIFTRIGYPLREEREMIDSTAMREAVINAIVHNDYSYGATPKFEFFSDRLEITSMGGLPYGVDEEDFFCGFSVPATRKSCGFSAIWKLSNTWDREFRAY